MKKYTKTGYISYHTNKIKELVDDGKINLAQKLAEELILEFPDDEILKVQLARIYILNKSYGRALSLLNEVIEEEVFIKKTALCIKLGEEELLWHLYRKYFSPNSKNNKQQENKQKIRIIKIYLNKKYNKEYNLNSNALTYAEKQNINYDEELAIDHIVRNHSLNTYKNKSLFSEHVNIRELFNKIKVEIKKHPNEGFLYQDITDSYYFYIPSCGVGKNGEVYDYLYVSTILGTNEILTMYPVSIRKNVEILTLEEENKPLKKVRTKTGLERFNERYNLK